MLRKWGTLVLFLLATPILALAQNTGKLSGVVMDGSTGEPLPGANVVIDGTQLGTATDVDGNYFILGVPVGTYTIRATFVGYSPQVQEGVDINAGYTRELNFELSPGAELDEIVVEYERPLIQKDALGVPNVVTAEDIQNLPVRGIADIAALQAGVVKEEGSGDLFIRGGREQEVSYYVDGVKVIGHSAVPTQAIQEQEMLIGSIPAKYGDAMSGIISITTRSGAPELFGSLELITSEVLDAYGYNDVQATLGGPIAGEKLNFFLSGRYNTRSDASPRAVGFPSISGADLEMLRNSPQSVRITNDAGDVAWIPFPGDIADGATLADVVARLEPSIPEGWHLRSGTPTPALTANTFTSDRFTREDARPNDDGQNLVFNGNLLVSPTQAMRLRIGGGFERDRGNEFSMLRSLYASNRYRKDDRDTWRAYGSWTHYLSDNTFFQLQADYSDYKGAQYHPDFSDDIRDVLFYGDIDHSANAVAQRYFVFNGSDSTYQRAYEDGDLPDIRDIHNTWAAPGVDAGGFTQWHYNQLAFRANATTQIGIHQIEFGGEYEKGTRRYFNMGAGTALDLAKYYTDGIVEGEADRAVGSYDDFDFEVLDDGIFYYGYNFLGTEEVDGQDVNAFVNATDGSDLSVYNMAPYEPIYYAGYIQDKIEYRDLVVNLGLRLDVFDNNALTLRDPFALFPITRAGEVGGAPSNIGSDYAVYFSNSGQVVGYRDLDGNFFNAQGQNAEATAIRQLGNTQVKETKVTSEVFKDYDPEVTFQPRIGLSFPVTDQALFFASYNVISQRPYEANFDTPQQWRQAAQQSKRNSNSGLKPEKTTNYELGFRQRLGARAALQISGFYKQIENLIGLRIVQNVTPNNYQTFDNVDFGTVKGMEVEFDLRRTNNVSLNANYTLSFAQGTGSDASTTAQIVWRMESDPFYPTFISPLDFDQRHKANITLDYRLGDNEGPQILGGYPLSNFGINVVGTFATGQPYTRRDDVAPIYQAFNGFLIGELNGETSPSTSLVNLRVDRRFDLGGTNLVAYLWVQNLFDQDNVVNVYSRTGLPDDDGWLDAEGQDIVSAIEDTQGGQSAQSFSDHYRMSAKSPFNYGIPRQIRRGVRVDFYTEQQRGSLHHSCCGDPLSARSGSIFYSTLTWRILLMKLSSKISRLLLVVLFFGSSVAFADVDKDKDKKSKQQSAGTLDKNSGACTTGSAVQFLDVNNVRASLYNTGGLFWKGSGNVYTVPKTGRANSVFASGIWLGGMVGSELRFAGTDYGPFEFWPGPLDAAGNAPADCAPYDRIFVVSKQDLQDFDAGLPHTSDIEDWPWELGAPVADGDGDLTNYNLAGGDRPGIIGDQTAWWIMNDAGGVHGTSASPPIKLEVQVTAFAFRRADALNNTTFYKYKLIYKGQDRLTDAYFGIWSDPDLGDASDDYVGSDPELGIGYVYNGDDFDGGADGYGDRPPALGYDYFQGPLVNNDGIDNDGDGEVDEDEERIAMSRFHYYNNDSSVQGNPGNAAEMYGYLRGIWRDGSPVTFGGSGIGGTTPAQFMFPNFPPAYWSEENTDNIGSANQPADRRFLLSSGPFIMNPGDVQEIVYGIVWAQAGDRLGSLAKMKADDALAQAAFDVDFEIPAPPDAPRVAVNVMDEAATLTWNYNPADNNFLDSYDVLDPFLKDVPDEFAPDKTYTFEGYNIYRFDNPQQSDAEGELVATFDVVNGVTTVTDVAFDEGTGVPITVVSARGTDSGLEHAITFTSLTNYTDYHYGVQAYAYNEYSAPKILLGPVRRVTVQPRRIDTIGGGTVVAIDAVEAQQAANVGAGADIVACEGEDAVVCVTKAGIGEGRVLVNIVDPAALTGHRYEVRFKTIQDTTDPDHPVDVITYDIVDATTGEVKVSGTEFFNRTHQAIPQRENIAVVDGLEFSVLGPAPGIKRVITTANAAGPLNPPDHGSASFNSNGTPTPDGNPVHCDADPVVVDYSICNDRPSQAQQVGPARWMINAGGGDGTWASFLNRSILGRGRPLSALGAFDYEWRFTGSSLALRAFEDDGVVEVPFELWIAGIGTPDDTSDDIRLIPLICEAACGGGTTPMVFDAGGDHAISGAANDPLTDWIYWYMPTDQSVGQGGYLLYENALKAGDLATAYGQLWDEILARQVLVGFNLGAAPPYAQELPEQGTIFRYETFKPSQPGDVFAIDTQALGKQIGVAEAARQGLEAVGIVPNPYKGASNYEVSVLNDVVRFTNLPDRARIRVYTLGGTLIWDETRGGTNNEWDLTTTEGLPLASGMYLVVVEDLDLEEKKIIKFGVVKKRIQLDLI